MKIYQTSVLIMIILMIAACSTMQRQDSAPLHDVDVSQIKNAVPESLPKSRYGNPKQYTVNGKTYHVLGTAIGYKAYGIASWYGTKFHNQRASDGEIYDMYKMTAANKVLPIPCFVRVKNLENNRMIIVKVIDRGPFAPHRIIDLSYVAAKKLGILAKGTAHVEVETINPIIWSRNHHFQSRGVVRHVDFQKGKDMVQPDHLKEPKKVRHIVPTRSKQHVEISRRDLSSKKIQKKIIQIAAYSKRYDAIVKKTKIESKYHYPVKIEPVKSHHKTLYRVIVGPINQQDFNKLRNAI